MLSRFSCVQLFATPWTVAHQAPLFMGFSWREYWSGLLLCPLPGGLSEPEIELASLTSPALAGRFFTTSATWEAPKDSQFLIPGTLNATFYGSGDLVDVIKDLEGRLSWIIWVGIKCNKCAHKRKAEGSLTQKRLCDQRSRVRVTQT